MEGYVSTTVKSRWTAVVIIILMITSQVRSHSLVLVQWNPHTPAVLGQSVILACNFNIQVTCSWDRGHNTETQVRSGDGYRYDGDYWKRATNDCSLTIDAVKTEDFNRWRCKGFSGANMYVYSPWTYITQQVTPSAPLVWFNSKIVSSIELPSPHKPSSMACSSESGNPPPSLYWEVNGTIYKGKLTTTPVGPNLYKVSIWWDSRWQIFGHASEVICKANHPGFTTTMATRVQLIRQYAPRTVKILAKGFNNDNIPIGSDTSVTLSCISDGHPQPTNYTWEVWSERDTRWKSYRHNQQNISATIKHLGKYRCNASNYINQHSPTTSTNQIVVTESTCKEAMLMNRNNDRGHAISDQSESRVIVAVTGGLLVVTFIIIVILTVALVKSRQRLSRVEMGSKSPSVASVAQLHRSTDPPATSHPTTDVTDADMVTYDNVSRSNAEPKVYWEAMRIYE